VCHVIDVGTCCPNLCKQTWAGSSVVKCVLIVTTKVGGSNLQNNKIFLHQIKLNWHRWSPQRVHEHSMSSLSSTAHGVPMECSWTPWTPCAVLMDCSWNAHGFLILLIECSRSPWEGVGVCKVLQKPVPTQKEHHPHVAGTRLVTHDTL
jgi:hypothetical protein